MRMVWSGLVRGTACYQATFVTAEVARGGVMPWQLVSHGTLSHTS